MTRSKITANQISSIVVSASDATQRSTSSTTYTTLTGAPSVTVDVGVNGILVVHITALIWIDSGSPDAYQSFALSGANTVASSDGRSISNKTSTGIGVGATFVLTGLTAGSTTVTLQQRVNATGNGNFMNKNLAVEVR